MMRKTVGKALQEAEMWTRGLRRVDQRDFVW